MARSVFCGRRDELTRLSRVFKLASEPDGEPQVVVILAESGFGKTRLVQEFFGEISKSRDAGGYWPKELRTHGDNLDVNPDAVDCNPEATPGFLWWGMRFADARGRNNVSAAMDSELVSLTTHLEVLTRSARDKDKLAQSLKAIGDAGLDVILDMTGGGLLKTGATFLQHMWGIGREFVADRGPPSLEVHRQREQSSKAEKIVASLRAVLAAREDRLPICIFVDDAHFADSDPESVDLLKKLLGAARADRWPLLLLVTHWQKEWIADESPIAQWLKPQGVRVNILELGRVNDLSQMLQERLPGLKPKQTEKILVRADGNPQFLAEIIEALTLKRNAKYFEDSDNRKPLTEKGLDTFLNLSVNRHELAGERLEAAGDEVLQILGIGSLQGMRFHQGLTAEVSAAIGGYDAEKTQQAIADAESPFALVRREPAVAEFLQRLYYEVAADAWRDHPKEGESHAALADGLRRRLRDSETLLALPSAERLALLGLAWHTLKRSDAFEDLDLAAQAAATAIQERLARSEVLVAGHLAQELVSAMRARGLH